MKRTNCLLAVIVLFLFLTACGAEPRIPTIGEPTGIEEVNLNPSLILTCEQGYFEQDMEQLVFMLENQGDEKYDYSGNHNVIEYEQDGVWHLLVAAPSDKEFPLTETAQICRAHSKDEVIIPMEYYGTEFPVGRYRFILDCSRRQDKEGNLYWHSEDFLSCVFEVR